MLLASLVAAPCLGVVQSQFLAASGNVALGDLGVRSYNVHIVVCAGIGSRVDGVDELRTAVGIYGMVATVIGYEHLVEAVALGNAYGYREHNAVAERHYCRLHVFVGIVSFGYCVGSVKQTRLEILVHEVEVDSDVLYAESFAMHLCERNLTGVVVAAIVERDAESYFVLMVVEQGDAVHSSAYYYYRVLHFYIVTCWRN